ncbi:spore coat protein [Paenibacillus sp. GCM10027629]|uniref:spore coat protein n=1 Tax=Paenibacillus sp. GCM10027629 TaxID=3273414 RepID=UPI003631DEB6
MYSQQQGQQQQHAGGVMQDKDMLFTILTDLKRTVGEYTTATTEASCPMVRQMFMELQNHSLRMQGDLYNFMQQNNMYTKPQPALKQAIDKQIQQVQQNHQQMDQFVQQQLNGGGQSLSFLAHTQAQATQHTNSGKNPYYM